MATTTVSGDSVTARHFGSLYTMVDYTSESSNFYFNATVRPSDRLTLTGSVLYNMSKAEQDEVIMPDVSAEAAADLIHHIFTFEEINAYSDLEYKYLQLGLGLEYMFQKGLMFTSEVSYIDLKDENTWVFGDQSGSLIMVRSGVQVSF